MSPHPLTNFEIQTYYQNIIKILSRLDLMVFVQEIIYPNTTPLK